MDKIKIKAEIRQVQRDLEYYMKEFGLNQKEAYEYLHERYYIRMKMTQDYVELEKREAIYKAYKEGGIEKWKENYMQNTT